MTGKKKRKKIEKLYLKGESINDIASKLDLTSGAIRYHLRKSGALPPAKPRNFFNPNRKEIEEMVKKNKSFNYIAKHFGTNPSTVRTYCQRNNIKRDYSGKIKYEFSKKQSTYIKKMLYEGAPINLISALMNVNTYVIDRFCKENGVSRSNKVYIFSQRGKSEFRKENSHLPLTEVDSMYQSLIDEILKESEKYKISRDSDFHKRYEDSQLDKLDQKFLRENMNKMTKKEIANHLGKSESIVGRYAYQNGLVFDMGRRSCKPPETKEFERDIWDPTWSTSALSEKYGFSVTTLTKWRTEICGTNFRTKIDPLMSLSSAEIKFERVLMDLDIVFRRNENVLNWVFDYYLGHKILIEVHGDYWHNLADVKEKDQRKKKEVESQGYRLLVIWEKELNEIEKVKKKVCSFFARSFHEAIHEKNWVNATQSGVLD